MRTGDLPVLQSPGFRLTCKPSAGHLSMSQPNPCSPWMQCWLLGPSPRVDGDWMGKDRVGGQSSVTKVLWMQRQWWDPAETAATLGFELKRMEGSRDKCDRMSWRHWWEGTQNLELCLWRGSGLEHQQGRGVWLVAQGLRKQKGAQEMRNPTVKATEQTPRRKEILKCCLLSLCCLPCAVNESGPCGENTV